MYIRNIKISRYISKLRLKQILNFFIPAIALFLFAFIPTSHNALIFSKIWSLIIWLIVIFFLIYLFLMNEIDLNNLVKGYLFIIIYMSLVTFLEMISNRYARISLYRMAPIFSLILLTAIKIKQVVDFKYMKFFLDIFISAMILWNLLIFLNSDFIKRFTINNYSQYYDLAIIYAFYYKKPVMSFGVHTWASYFYMLTFYLSFLSAQKTGKIRFYVYCICIAFFTLFLKSNASLIYGGIMIYFLIRLLIRKPIILSLLGILGFLIIIKSWDTLVESYQSIINSENNGILARYFGEHTVFENNIKIIKNSLGIGFTIPDNIKIGYSDSGFMVYLTMGSFPLLIVIYTRIYNFLVRNLPSKNELIFICLIIFSFELALPASFSYRFPFALVFVIYYLQSLEKSEAVFQ